MIIHNELKKELLAWDNTKPIYKQFEQKCEILTNLSGLIISPEDYQIQYEAQKSSVNKYMDLQDELYRFLYHKYPNVEFAMAGRLKSPFSYYEKVIRKFIEQLLKDEYKIVKVLDVYAMKVLLTNINYPIDKVSVDMQGIYIDCGPNEFRIEKDDCFEFSHEGNTISAVVKEGASNIYIDHVTPHICTTTRDKKDLILPLSLASIYKKSSKEHLVKYCYKFQEDIGEFCNHKKFETKKMKDYIEKEKPSGYASLQWSFYSEEDALGIECQTRTLDMEIFNNKERAEYYKPDEHKLTKNALQKMPYFALTTRVNFAEEGFTTWRWNDEECFEYLYGIPLKEYRKQMQPTVQFKEKEDGAR